MILPQLLGWDIHQNDAFFITFLVATHLATALVLLGFFRRDWVRILRGLGRSLRRREIGADSDARLGWLLVVGTIPAGLLGLLLEHALRDLFASARSASFFLILNGAHAVRRRAAAPAQGARRRGGRRGRAHRPGGRAGAARWRRRGPGARARSRASRARARRWRGGLVVGLSNEDAARFAFLLATPIIGAAALLKLPDLLGSGGNGVRGPALVGALCSALTAYLAVRFLMRYFETNRLTPFACVLRRGGRRGIALLRALRARLSRPDAGARKFGIRS